MSLPRKKKMVSTGDQSFLPDIDIGDISLAGGESGEINLRGVNFRDIGELIDRLAGEIQSKNINKIDLSNISIKAPYSREVIDAKLKTLDNRTLDDLSGTISFLQKTKNLFANIELRPLIIRLASAAPKKGYDEEKENSQLDDTAASATILPRIHKVAGSSSRADNSQGRASHAAVPSSRSTTSFYNAVHYQQELSVINGMVSSLSELQKFDKLATRMYNDPSSESNPHQIEVFQKINLLTATNLTENLDETDKYKAANLIANILQNDLHLQTVSLNHNSFSVSHLKIIINTLIDIKQMDGYLLKEINLQNCIKKEDVGALSKELNSLKQHYGKSFVNLDHHVNEELNRLSTQQKSSALQAKSHFGAPAQQSSGKEPTMKSNKITLPPLKPKP